MKKRMNAKCIFIITVTIFTFYLSGCSDNSSNPLDFNAFSTADDVELGRQLDSQIRVNPAEYPLYTYYAPNTYVQGIVDEIVALPKIKYKGIFVYKCQIIKNDSVINAFATPGGYIYVYTGLLKFIDNEATLAGILGHEIAHAEQRHATKRMTKAYGVEFLLNLVLGNNPNQYAQIAANLFTGLGFLENSREDEYDADDYSFKYLLDSKWYPGAITYFFDKLKTGDTSFLTVLLSTHPMPEDRITKVKELINTYKVTATEANLFTERYVLFKQHLP